MGRILDGQDINGDGFTDIAVGTPDNEEVCLLFGDIAVDTSGTVRNKQQQVTENGGRLEIGFEGLNSDGIHDVIVSAQRR